MDISQGELEASVSFISGDDLEGLQAAAGDFMFIGGDGNPRYLMAYGKNLGLHISTGYTIVTPQS